MSSSRTTQYFRHWLPGILISTVAVLILVRSVDWQTTLFAFKKFDIRIIPLYIVLYLASSGSRAMASRALLGKHPTIGQSFMAFMQGYFLNNFLPLRLGELGRAFLLGQKTGLSIFRVLSATIVERIIDLALAASLVIITFSLAFKANWMKPVVYSTLGMVIVGLFSLYIMVRFRVSLHMLIERFSKNVPFIQRSLSIFDSLMDGLSALTSPRSFMVVLIWMICSWFFNITVFWAVLKVFVPASPFLWATFVVGVTAFGGAIPSAPATLGVLEGAIVFALVLLGVASGTALAYAVVLHLLVIIMVTLIGFYGFSSESESIEELYNRLILRKREIQLSSPPK